MSAMTFDEFRRKLADSVTVAINSGVLVSASKRNACCPLGCLPGMVEIYEAEFGGAKDRTPPSWLAAKVGVDQSGALQFLTAFSQRNYDGTCEYAELGRLYRERFP